MNAHFAKIQTNIPKPYPTDISIVLRLDLSGINLIPHHPANDSENDPMGKLRYLAGILKTSTSRRQKLLSNGRAFPSFFSGSAMNLNFDENFALHRSEQTQSESFTAKPPESFSSSFSVSMKSRVGTGATHLNSDVVVSKGSFST